MSLGPDNWQEAKEAWKKQDEWRRESARRYEEKRRDEAGSKYRDLGSNPERRKREFNRAYGGEERVLWMRRQPSVVSGKTPCVNAHVPDPNGPSGMGRKADAKWTVPLTLDEEKELHRIGVESFQEKHQVDLTEEAKATDRRWLEHQGERTHSEGE